MMSNHVKFTWLEHATPQPGIGMMETKLYCTWL